MSYKFDNGQRHSRIHASSFQVRHNINTGEVTERRESRSVQDFYNAWAEFWGWVLPWGGIGLAAYYGIRHLLGM